MEQEYKIDPEQAEMSGGEALVRALVDAGVEYIFGYPGGAALHIYDALFKQNRIEHILVRHEQAATHMADGYARATGKPGVVLVTSGPGASNTITGIATAHMDSIPVIVISAQVPFDQIGTDAFQETDMIGLSRPVVKHSFLVMKPELIPEAVAKAFYIAQTGRPGPVVIDIPKDMTDPAVQFPYRYPEKVFMRSYNPADTGHPGQIRRALDLLLAAKRPVIYVGGGAIQGNASAELSSLVTRLGFPVVQTLMGLGAVPASARESLGMLGMHGTYEANMAMHHADLIFSIGARFDDRVTNNPDKFSPQARIIHLDIDPASISKIINANVPIVGLAKPTLRKMNELLVRSGRQPDSEALAAWWKRIEEWRQAHGLRQDFEEEGNSAIMPQKVIQLLHEITEGNAFVVSDVGQHQMFAAQYYHFDEPRRWINSGGLGTMGFGLPAAMGIALTRPDNPVVVVTGEGSIQMNIQELSTCKQYGLPIKIISLNNEALGMVKQWQDISYGGRHSSSTYQGSLPDFAALAESYGHLGIRISRPSDLRPVMERVFSAEMADRLVFLDIMVDPNEHVYPMAIKGGGMNDMMLSKDMRT